MNLHNILLLLCRSEWWPVVLCHFSFLYIFSKPAYRPSSDSHMENTGSDLPLPGRELSRGRSPDQWPQKLDQNRRLDSHGHQSRYPEYYPAEGDLSRGSEQQKYEQNRVKNEGKARRQAPEHHLTEVRTKYPEEYLAGRNRYTEADQRYNQEPPMTSKERACRDDPSDRDRTRRKDRDQEKERRRKADMAQYGEKTQEKLIWDPSRDRLRSKEVDMGQNGYRHRSRDGDLDLEIDKRGHKERVRDGERHRSRDRSRGREFDGPSSSKFWSEESDEVFEESSFRSLSKGQSPRYRGMHKGPVFQSLLLLRSPFVGWTGGGAFNQSEIISKLGESSDSQLCVWFLISVHGTNPHYNQNGTLSRISLISYFFSLCFSRMDLWSYKSSFLFMIDQCSYKP